MSVFLLSACSYLIYYKKESIMLDFIVEVHRGYNSEISSTYYNPYREYFYLYSNGRCGGSLVEDTVEVSKKNILNKISFESFPSVIYYLNFLGCRYKSQGANLWRSVF